MENFADRLKLLRLENNLSQNQLAKILQINQSNVSVWEAGKELPRAEYLIILAKYFKCSVDYLLGLED